MSYYLYLPLAFISQHKFASFERTLAVFKAWFKKLAHNLCAFVEETCWIKSNKVEKSDKAVKSTAR